MFCKVSTASTFASPVNFALSAIKAGYFGFVSSRTKAVQFDCVASLISSSWSFSCTSGSKLE